VVKRTGALLFLFLVPALCGADYPQAGITNGVIKAKLYLPDPTSGYYRGTRFDWSGVIASLEYQGHHYFGPWLAKHDPKLHDAIAGPVEEFRTNNSGLGYDEAKPGETFIKIGVGVLRKGNEQRYAFTIPFEIVDTGKWGVQKGSDWVEFTQTLKDKSGYAYVYRKRVSLTKGKPEMVLEHSLRNAGSREMETTVYDHNFLVLDNLPSGPGFVLEFPFNLKASRDLMGLAEIRGNQIVYLQELAAGQNVGTDLTGFGASASDYDIKVENRKVGAGMRITGDRPLDSLYFWTARTTVCPEPYIRLRIEPGRQADWRIRYTFYTLAAAGAQQGKDTGVNRP
jgi:hypothetical protein